MRGEGKCCRRNLNLNPNPKPNRNRNRQRSNVAPSDGMGMMWFGIRHGLDWYAMTFYLCTAWPAVESIKLMRLVAIIDVPFQVRVWQLIF